MNERYFDLRKARSYQAVTLRRVLYGVPGMLVVLIIMTFSGIEALLHENFLPLVIWVALIGCSYGILESFRRTKLMNGDDDTDSLNIAEKLSYHIMQHIRTKKTLSAQTFLEAATESKRGLFVLHSIGIDRADILSALLKSPITTDFSLCLQWCLDAMHDIGTPRLDSTATLYAFLTHVPCLTALTEAADLSQDDLRNIVKAEAFHFAALERRHHPLSPKSLVRILGSIGRYWVIGYNTDLERLTTNLSTTILSHEENITIHTDIIDRLLTILQSGTQANMLLLGAAGTGKRTLVKNIAYALRKKEIKHSSQFTDVLELKTTLLLSGSGDSDTALLHAVNDAKQGGHFILVLNDLSLFLKAADAKLQGILVSILQSKNIRTICIADSADYHALIKTNPLLDHLFQKITVEEPCDEDVMNILLDEYFSAQRRTHIRMKYNVLKTLLALCKQYVTAGSLPGKATDILREVMASTTANHGYVVTEDMIRDIVSERTRIDVRTISENEKDTLQHLQERLQSHIIGQQHAIECLVSALKRRRMNVSGASRPMGTFLFLGTTGLGKTETAKALALEFFGSADHMIRVDLNEYASEDTIPLLIGGQTNNGFVEGFLTKKVSDTPYSLILLDEIEKASPKILNLFLQILDEGILMSGDGLKTDFRNTIIIATSNAGGHWMTTHQIPQDIKARETFRTALIETIVGERTFSPEFVNRFDEVIIFTPPTPEEIRQIAILMVHELIQRFTTERGISLIVEPSVMDFLATKGFSTEFGAREMRRTITQTIENYLADYLLTHDVKRGDVIEVQREDLT